MSWRKVKLGEVLKQYRIEHRVQNDTLYKQVSILNDGSVILRGEKIGKEIGRKRQFLIDIKKYSRTLIFTRQLLLQGSIGIAPKEVDGCIVTENMPMFSIGNIEMDYLQLIVQSSYFRNEVAKIPTTGSAQKSIHERQFLDIEIPFPSISIQKEVVKKFLKFQSQNSELTTELTHQQNILTQLRQAFLREAMQGKLLPQNKSVPIVTNVPKEETATDLLKKIKAEKEKLIAEKKLKKETPFPPIKEEEIPFAIPENWVWCRLGEICNYGSSPKAEPKHLTENSWVLDLEDIEKETSRLICKVRFSERNSLSTKSVFKKGDVLYSKLRPYLDKVIVADEDGVCTTEILPLKFYGNVNSFFLRYALKRSDFLSYVNSVTKGMKMPRLGTEEGRMSLIPLPPLAEQKRIVKKLEELMNLCEELKTTITDNQNYTNQLLQVALKDALSADKAGLQMKSEA